METIQFKEAKFMKVKIKGIIIGEKKFNHQIEMPDYSEAMREYYIAEYLKRQYPEKFKKICDIESEVVS